MVLESHEVGDDPAVTDPEHYTVIFENERVRVLEYRDQPGDRTHPHRHPDSVMYTLTAFRRRVTSGERAVEVDIPAGAVRWVGAQEHVGHNIGDTATHTIFVELKEPSPLAGTATLGPTP
ncbi:cytoplasmic protein [Dactylosporangium vinaceum]|uniref:Cytoplasmic protein n=1 Tax=Dactylosporangium vinaceum TaxID=53362 RepID=A0ABV5MFE8_9ACTN|nr:cytoplasmic protein [Dactylosporangium vinaceum]UAB98711.1 cytoplasmic protein [Dactylosporangium vinaceum]